MKLTGGSVTAASYSCAGGEPVTVQYMKAGANSFAPMEIDREERSFVNAVSGSGARYVSGELVWWTKGNNATLESALDGAARRNASRDLAIPTRGRAVRSGPGQPGAFPI
ncbi:MliC family protein [Paracoccus denitrificans]|uniref:MliC family protein n=1 Tax=Paracoccus denitrificans TaxID=266 RepID=UPI00349E6C16